MFPRAPRPHQILAGGVEGESGYMPVSAGVVSPGLPFEDFRFVINLPAGKTCDYCVLQLLWAARSNDTYHLSCADIAITENGTLKTPEQYSELAPEEGNDTPRNQVYPGTGCTAGGTNGGADDNGVRADALTNESAASAIIITIVLIFTLACFLATYGYYLFHRIPASEMQESSKLAKPSESVGSSTLPAGWREQIDPSTGKPYFIGPSGEARWELPPSGNEGSGAAEEWTTANDPQSGQTYYVSKVSGLTSWSRPSGFI